MDLKKLKAFEESTARLTTFHDHLHEKKHFPHKGQLLVARALNDTYFGNPPVVWAQCGRNFGKSTGCAAYNSIRRAITIPNQQCYIISHEAKNTREIYWDSYMLEDMLPKQYVTSINKTSARVEFDNRSFIKLDGADNVPSLRGYKPSFLVTEESQNWKKDAWIAMEPNVLAKKAPVLHIGTPPDKECWFTERREFILAEIKRGNRRYTYMELPTDYNPHMSKDLLEELKRGHLDRGEEAIWLREYMAKYVPGGATAVWGTLWDRRKFVRKDDELIYLCRKNANALQWYVIADPGTTSCFAVLFIAYNPVTCEVFILREIYERDRSRASSSQIWDRIVEITSELRPQMPLTSWFLVADEAAAWFINEISYNYGHYFRPTQKHLKPQEQNISIIRDILYHQRVYYSDLLRYFPWEMDNYVTDENGKLPKANDHLIDGLCYFVADSNYRFVEGTTPLEPFKARTPEQEFANRDDSWDKNIGDLGNYDYSRDWLY